MRYNNIKEAIFLDRPNRFIAHVLLNEEKLISHVKNTGRCRELLVPGTKVYLSETESLKRKTLYDLISVYKGDRLINIDSLAPNAIAAEYLPFLFPDLMELRREVKYGNSRFDFYGIKSGRPFYLEVKGVTLERDGMVLFPDAPTLRGLKHLHELTELKRSGTDAYLMFIIQMHDVGALRANRETDPAFADALLLAKETGVGIFAVDCLVTPESAFANKPVPIEFI